MKFTDAELRRDTEPEPEVVLIAPEPEEPKVEIPHVSVGPIMRTKIEADFLLYKSLKKAGYWWKYHDLHRYTNGRLVGADCDTCQEMGEQSGMRRVYGKAPTIVMKCLKCGAELLVKKIHNWEG